MAENAFSEEIKPVIMVATKGGISILTPTGRSMFQVGKDIDVNVVVVALDVDGFGGIQKAAKYAEGVVEHLRERAVLLVAAMGLLGGDMRPLNKHVVGVIERPKGDTFNDWKNALLPLIIGMKYPNYADTLDPSETQGGVTTEEFEESIRRALS